MRKTVDRIHICWICGKDFTIKVRISDKKIMSKCFHSRIRKHLFLKWSYRLDNIKDFSKTTVVFTSTFWKIVGYTSLQRWIIYNIWWIFKGWQKNSYWECARKGCNKK